jgi:presenilin-like A22 family membrane protease
MDKDRMRTHGPLIAVFILIQIIGLVVLSLYAPTQVSVPSENGTQTVSQYNLPFGFNPPSEVSYEFTFIQLVLSIAFAVFIFLILMKLQVIRVLRFWFFLVSVIALSVAFAAFLKPFAYGAAIALLLGLILGFLKTFRPSIIFHNLGELFVYPGIAAVLVPLFNIPSIIILFVVISLYDMYAVWHSGFMQRMAKYQIRKVKVFSGLLIPQFITKAGIVNPLNKKYVKKNKLAVALLGGGDIIFPMILAGVLLHAGFFGAAVASLIGATIGLSLLILNSRKGVFYPAMPFITLGCFAGISIIMLFRVIM